MSNPLEREDVLNATGVAEGVFRTPEAYRDGWLRSLDGGQPLVLHLRGIEPLSGLALTHAAMETALGCAFAVEDLQRRMSVGASDPRTADQRGIETTAQLPRTPAVGVDPEQWENLRRTQDPDIHVAPRRDAARAVERFAQQEPEAFHRLNQAAARHDVAVEGLFSRALWTEDALVYPAVVRGQWERSFGRGEALPQLPGYVAAFVLSRVFKAAGVGAVLAAIGFSSVPVSAKLSDADHRRSLQKEHSRRLRFWRDKADSDWESFALGFVALVGNIFASEMDSLDRLSERAALVAAKPRPGTWDLIEEDGAVGGEG